MKKKIMSIALAIALIAIMVGSSLAYFTAEDEVTNTFTIGSVLIEIYENNEPTPNDVIEIKKPLTPVVNSTPSADESYIHKAIKVQSTGENAAYVRTHLAIPANLVNYLILDVNTADGWTGPVAVSEATVEENGIGVKYVVYTYDYTAEVAPDAFTPDLLKGVYLASDVDIKDNPDTETADLEFCKPDGNGGYTFSGFVAHNKVTDGYKSVTVNVRIASQAIQAQGFNEGATSALDTGFGQGKNPWQQ